MTDELADLKSMIQRLSAKLDGFAVRLGVLERAFEEELDVRTLNTRVQVVEVADQKAIETAAKLGEELGEATRLVRGVKDSVSKLRRVLDPSDVTGQHNVVKPK